MEEINIKNGYIPKLDITVIFEEVVTEDGTIISTEIVNFYYGEPNLKDTGDFYLQGKQNPGKPIIAYYT